MKNHALQSLVWTYPYPVADVAQRTVLAIKRWQSGEGLDELPIAICRLTGLLLRLDAAVAIASLAASGKTLPELNAAVIEALRCPTDGDWLTLLQRIAKGLGDKPALFEALARALRAKVLLPKVDALQAPEGTSAQSQTPEKGAGAKKATLVELLSQLVAYRNRVVHGEPLNTRDHAQAAARLQAVLAAHCFYQDYRLLAHAESGPLDCTGPGIPRPLARDGSETASADEFTQAAVGTVLFAQRGEAGQRLIVSPLLHYVVEGGGAVHFDDLFFVNRGTAEAAEYLAYRLNRQVTAQQLGAFDAFRALLRKLPAPPIPKEKRLQFDGLADYHGQRFVGREDVLAEIDRLLHEGEGPYIELRALAGFGKSAILAHLYSRYGSAVALPWPELGDRGLIAPSPHPAEQDRWAFHFCMATDGRDDPLVALQSLTAQLCDGAGLERHPYLAAEVERQRERFLKCLAKASEQLHGKARINVCIDALDEGIPGYGKHTIPGVLLGEEDIENGLLLPPQVRFLISYRVDEQGRSRADRYLEHIPAAWRVRLSTADPLHGLQREHLEQLLGRYAETIKPADTVVAAVWDGATRDHGQAYGADPFYLRFLIDGVKAGHIDPTREESVPRNLSSVFEQFWMDLPTDHDYALHRLLAMLSVLREYASDELMGAVLNQDRTDGQALSLEQIQTLRAKAGKLLVYDGDRYGLFHDRIAWFLTGQRAEALDLALRRYEGTDPYARIAPTQVAVLHGSLGALADRWSDTNLPSAVRDYGLKHGPYHLLCAGRVDDAAILLTDYPTAHNRLMAEGTESWIADLDTADKAVRNEASVSSPRDLQIWSAFAKEHAHILRRGSDEWPSARILFQLAVDHADDSPVTQAAEGWLRLGHCDWFWFRRIPRPVAMREASFDRLVLEGHNGSVKGTLVTGAGGLVSWSTDGKLISWDLTRGGVHKAFAHGPPSYPDGVDGVIEVRNGNLVSWDKRMIYVWDIHSAAPLQTLDHLAHKAEIHRAEFERPEEVLGLQELSNGRLLSYSQHILIVWDYWRGVIERERTEKEDVSRVRQLGSNILLLEYYDFAKLWNLSSDCCARIDIDPYNLILVDSPSMAKRLVSWKENKLQVWEASSGRRLATLYHDRSPLSEDGVVNVIALSDSRILTWGGFTLKVWDLKIGRAVRFLEHHPTEPISEVLILKSGYFVSWSPHALKIWDHVSVDPILAVDFPQKALYLVRELKDETLLCVGSGMIRVLDPLTGSISASERFHEKALVFANDLINEYKIFESESGNFAFTTLTQKALWFWSPKKKMRPKKVKIGGSAGWNEVRLLQIEGNRLVVWTDRSKMWVVDIDSQRLLGPLGYHVYNKEHIDAVSGLPDGRFVSWSHASNQLHIVRPPPLFSESARARPERRRNSLVTHFDNPIDKLAIWFAARLYAFGGRLKDLFEDGEFVTKGLTPRDLEKPRDDAVSWHEGCIAWVDYPWQVVAKIPLSGASVYWHRNRLSGRPRL